MTYHHILIDHRDDVATLTLNDPATLNAASFDMTLEITSALEAVVRDGARALIITGTGRGFCSGANLSGDIDPHAPSYDAGLQLDSHYAPLMRAIRDLPIPLITAVNGAAAGIGCSMALAGDLILASENAYFLQAFRRIGLVPDGGSSYLLTRAVGRTRAMEMMLLGEKIPAAKALDWGLVTRVYSADRLMDEARMMALDLARGPTIALSGIRAQCWRASEAGFEDVLAMERRQQRDAGRTADHREGVTAFLEKRPAVFTGQ